MFGNLVNNVQLKQLIDSKVVEIAPFNEKLLSLVHYTLHPLIIKERQPDGDYKTICNLRETPNGYSLKKNSYVIVEIQEQIKLNDEQIVGHFIPSSDLIELGLGIVAGKIDKKFGTTNNEKGLNQEKIVFGLKNLLPDTDITIKSNLRLAHLELFDLRGLASDKTELSEDEIKTRLRRMLKAMDDGVIYQ